MYRITNTSAVERISDGAMISPDPTTIDRQEYQDWLAASNTPEPAPGLTPDQLQAEFTAAIQRRLDAFAQTRGYDGILSACTYATDPNPRFAAEGQRAVDLRSQTWAKGYEILADVQAGTRSMPASLADIEPELPALAWPNLA